MHFHSLTVRTATRRNGHCQVPSKVREQLRPMRPFGATSAASEYSRWDNSHVTERNQRRRFRPQRSINDGPGDHYQSAKPLTEA
jgi:hypothetical protein